MPKEAAEAENGIVELLGSSHRLERTMPINNASPTKSIRTINGDEDDGNFSLLQEHMLKESKTIDDFTRIIADWRNERDQRQRGGLSTDAASVRTSVFGENAAGSSNTGLGNVNSLRVRSSTLSLRGSGRGETDLDAASQYSYDASSINGDQEEVSPSISPAVSTSHGLSTAEVSNSNAKVRCTCCCGKGTRKCKRARRATREWGEVESDLRLAAEIGQALLRRNDTLQNELSQNQQDYSNRLDSLMKRLSSSIKENGNLEKQREQNELNLEATEASNRSLVRELDETRKEVIRIRGINAKSVNLESRLDKALREAADAKQELIEERKVIKRMEKLQRQTSEQLRIVQIEASNKEVMNEEDRIKRQREMRSVAEAKMAMPMSNTDDDEGHSKEMTAKLDLLQMEVAELKDMLEVKNEEVIRLREELDENLADHPPLHGPKESVFGSLSAELVEEEGKEEGSLSVRSNSRSPPQNAKTELAKDTPSLAPEPFSFRGGESRANVADGLKQTPSFLVAAPPPVKLIKETRTAQLFALMEAVQRIFTRLASADVDTLSKRLQRQNLTGDVGHLARTTVNGILKDVDALREHFRKAMEMESRSRDTDTQSQKSGKSERESESLIARKEFFALIKVFRELLVELIRLRRTINEVSLQPQYAARILQEQLGVNMSEDKGVGAWIGRLFTTVPSHGIVSTLSSQSQITPFTGANRASGRSVSAGQIRSHAIAAVVPSTVAVEGKGAHATEPSNTNFNALPSHARLNPPDRQRSISRMQSRNLSGLFVGSLSAGSDGTNSFSYSQSGNIHSRIASEQGSNRHNRLSRIVDDDEVSIHQGFTPRRGLRPRNLSDSSIRTSYMDDEDRLPLAAHTAISRIITPSSLSLQASSNANAGVAHSYTSASIISDDDSNSTMSKGTSPSMKEVPSNAGFLSSIAPRATMSKALNFLAGPSLSGYPNQPPTLRSTSSSVKLSLAAASAKNETKTNQRAEQIQSAKDNDAFQVSSSRAKEMGF